MLYWLEQAMVFILPAFEMAWLNKLRKLFESQEFE
jgi:hypothetical protein